MCWRSETDSVMGPKEALHIKKDSLFLRQSEHSSNKRAFTVNLTISNSKFRYVFTGTVPKGWKLLAAFYFLHLGRNNEKNVHHLSTLMTPTLFWQIFNTLDAIWQILIFLQEMFWRNTKSLTNFLTLKNKLINNKGKVWKISHIVNSAFMVDLSRHKQDMSE